ncbi:2-hydroxyacid dehydrogenase [Lacihabitans soyangensis]|uniref:2-hydroxyacid dehydrogenase n=1 Tax=Lacihabitans soyangensis TaxID=869394 RepID=A0AAE3KXP4_9BACT|nr:2-hydroxyacid dehydrogenase [Lacihabitans soyangensis]MCP9765505.1 2-hydroxyacid dehydrogenase [Lacihabitans soyangensis]
MKVAVFSTKPYEKTYLEKFNHEGNHHLVYFDNSLNLASAEQAKGFEAVCVFVSDILDENTIAKLASLGVKLIDLRSAGFNNVDIVAAKKHNLKILRVPAYSPQAIAEHAVALILTLNRKTHKAYNRVREGNFSVEKLMGFNLFGKTVGIIGTGKIGTAFAKIMLGFGCKVLANDLLESKELQAEGVHYTTFDEVLAASDIVSLHCPLTHETKHLFDSKAFDKMKTGAMLINTSRGAIINTSHAVVALKKRKLGYLGIDVYEEEESLFFKDLSESLIQDDVIERLMSFHNVLITPHLGFFTEEALEQIVKITLKNFSDFEKGLPSENEVV